MNIKIDDKKVIKLVTIIFNKEKQQGFNIYQKLFKIPIQDQECIQYTLAEMETKFKEVVMLSFTIVPMTTKIFLDEPTLTKIK